MTDPFTLPVIADGAVAATVEGALEEAGDAARRVAGDAAATVRVRHVGTVDGGLERVEEELAGLDGRAAGVVLLDPSVPDGSGVEAVEAVLERTDRAPLLVLAGDDPGARAVRAGAHGYLSPEDVTPDSLVRAVRGAVERAALERELRRRNERLALLNRLLCHDVKNDLSLVVGRADELEGHVDDGAEDLLAEVAAAGNHVLQLTRAVGDSLEAVAGGVAHLAAVDLRRVLRNEVERARRRYDAGTVVVDGAVPAVEVRANRLLSSVFGNLIGNALVYTDADDPEVRIRVEVNEETVTVTVADDGPGIPARRDVFERGVSGEEGGTGTGLYVVERLVRAYGGDVSAENTATGARFTVTLRRA